MSVVKKTPQTKAENPSVVVQSEQSVSMVLLWAWSSPVLPEQPLERKSRKFLGQHQGVPPLIPCWGTVCLPLVLFLVGPWLQLDSVSLGVCAGYSAPDQHQFAIKEKIPQKSHPKQSCSLGGKFKIQAE